MRVFSLITLCTLTACESLFGSFIDTATCDPQTADCQSNPTDMGMINNQDMSELPPEDLSFADLSMTPPPDMTPPPQPGMLFVPGKTFMLGRQKAMDDRDYPAYNVTVNSFYLDIDEVKTKDYKLCNAASAQCTPATGGNCNYVMGNTTRDEHSVNCVTKTQAEAYCTWKSKRLPTEAEWELAATGGRMVIAANAELYPWGEAVPTAQNYVMLKTRLCWDRLATCLSSDLTGGIYETYMGAPFAGGFVNLAGNLREWTSTEECTYNKNNNTCDKAGSGKFIIRGASFAEALIGEEILTNRFLRATWRQPQLPTDNPNNRGFRCAKTYQ